MATSTTVTDDSPDRRRQFDSLAPKSKKIIKYFRENPDADLEDARDDLGLEDNGDLSLAPRKYAHLLPEDAAIWDGIENPLDVESVDEIDNEKQRRIIKALQQPHRFDTLVEVANKAMVSASYTSNVAQMYAHLIPDEWTDRLPALQKRGKAVDHPRKSKGPAKPKTENRIVDEETFELVNSTPSKPEDDNDIEFDFGDVDVEDMIDRLNDAQQETEPMEPTLDLTEEDRPKIEEAGETEETGAEIDTEGVILIPENVFDELEKDLEFYKDVTGADELETIEKAFEFFERKIRRSAIGGSEE